MISYHILSVVYGLDEYTRKCVIEGYLVRFELSVTGLQYMFVNHRSTVSDHVFYSKSNQSFFTFCQDKFKNLYNLRNQNSRFWFVLDFLFVFPDVFKTLKALIFFSFKSRGCELSLNQLLSVFGIFAKQEITRQKYLFKIFTSDSLYNCASFWFLRWKKIILKANKLFVFVLFFISFIFRVVLLNFLLFFFFFIISNV